MKPTDNFTKEGETVKHTAVEGWAAWVEPSCLLKNPGAQPEENIDTAVCGSGLLEIR